MDSGKLIGSPVFLAILVIFGGASWAILGFFGVSPASLELYGVVVAVAILLNMVYMVKKIVKPTESKLPGLGLRTDAPTKNEQKKETGHGDEDERGFS
jgi:hypothetical protein